MGLGSPSCHPRVAQQSHQEVLQCQAPPSPILTLRHSWRRWQRGKGTAGTGRGQGTRERKALPLMQGTAGRAPREAAGTHLTLIRYWARLMLAADPVMVTCLSVEPSTGLAILI